MKKFFAFLMLIMLGMAAYAVLNRHINIARKMQVHMTHGQIVQRFAKVIVAGRTASAVRLQHIGIVNSVIRRSTLNLNAVLQRGYLRRVIQLLFSHVCRLPQPVFFRGPRAPAVRLS